MPVNDSRHPLGDELVVIALCLQSKAENPDEVLTLCHGVATRTQVVSTDDPNRPATTMQTAPSDQFKYFHNWLQHHVREHWAPMASAQLHEHRDTLSGIDWETPRKSLDNFVTNTLESQPHVSFYDVRIMSNRGLNKFLNAHPEYSYFQGHKYHPNDAIPLEPSLLSVDYRLGGISTGIPKNAKEEEEEEEGQDSTGLHDTTATGQIEEGQGQGTVSFGSRGKGTSSS